MLLQRLKHRFLRLRPPQAVDLGGFRIEPRPGWSNAEDYETRWGEAGGLIGGVANLIVDTAHNLGYDDSMTKAAVDYFTANPSRLLEPIDKRAVMRKLTEWGRSLQDRYYRQQYLEK